jgi:hypothetical protein
MHISAKPVTQVPLAYSLQHNWGDLAVRIERICAVGVQHPHLDSKPLFHPTCYRPQISIYLARRGT